MPPKSTAILQELPEKVTTIFDQAQVSLANHRKNCVALYKLHVQAGNVTELVKNGKATKLVGERAFGDTFIDMITRVLVVKKGPAVADRVVKFVGTYVKFTNEKAAEEKAKASESASALAAIEEDDDDSLAIRFLSRLLKWLLQGFLAKNKTVRYRSIFIVSELISHLGEIDEDTYNLLRENLMDRVRDKEPLIRVYAVVALSKLVGTEDPSEVQEDEKTILDVLLEITCFDDAAEVRRAALLNIPLDNSTLGTVLSRTRDTDPVNRKFVYSVLQSKLVHPRQLSITLREQVVKDGLGDREPAVRLAAGKLVASWYDKLLGEVTIPEGETWKGDDGSVMRGFVAFLGLFDVVGPGEAIAVDAMLSIFVTRPELADVFEFPEAYWKELTPESAVLSRAFVEHYANETRLEAAALPVVTAFAFYIQEAYNSLLEVLQEGSARLLDLDGADDEEEVEAHDEELAKREVTLGELLRIAIKLDYMDEIGRRKVFSVVKEMLSHPDLPSGLIDRCVDVLKVIMPNERELIRVVVEVIIDVRENDQTPESDNETAAYDDSRSEAGNSSSRWEKSLRRKKDFHDMTAEERVIADVIELRCLMVCIALLERVHGNFEDNSTLEGILSDLIIPSVKRKEPALREKGLISLGLCCLIAKNMALSSFQLFLNQVQSVPEDMKMRVLQVIFDLLIMYPQEFFGRSEDIAKRITSFLLEIFHTNASDTIPATMAVGFSKLLLAGTLTDTSILVALALSYVNFETRDNQELRQCLSYFFPVYCYSSLANQSRMQSIFMNAFDLFVNLHEESDSDEIMISPYQFGLLMVDWTNSQKAANVNGSSVPRNIHADVAVDILRALYDEDRSANDRKTLCQLLGNLDIATPVDDRTLFKIHLLLSHLQQQYPLGDTSLDRMFRRFKDGISKLFKADLEKLDAMRFLDEEFCDLYHYVGVDMPDEDPDAAKTRKTLRGVPEAGRLVRFYIASPSRVDVQRLSSKNEERSSEAASERSPAPKRKRRKSGVGEFFDKDEALTSQIIANDRTFDDSYPPTNDNDRSPVPSKETKSTRGSPSPQVRRSHSMASGKVKRKLTAKDERDDGSATESDADARKMTSGQADKKGVKRNHSNVPDGLKSPKKKRTRTQKSKESSRPARPTSLNGGAWSTDQGPSDDE
ncbi:hypothetical protein AX15_000413 [Amanita polypyramis BW_CC]|nr:hypothetical protein AX15_000413 [Amanita polypyramis BW_CC]